mmetsp:Transcript_29998/g.43665  ORF Transcript_29998/g.43665 Transcript_29998/m.43665 type:complete len:89 (-) Transcript_29998:116-382(-)
MKDHSSIIPNGKIHRFTSIRKKEKGKRCTHTQKMSEYQLFASVLSFFFLNKRMRRSNMFLEDAFTVHVTQPFSNSPKDGLEEKKHSGV